VRIVGSREASEGEAAGSLVDPLRVSERVAGVDAQVAPVLPRLRISDPDVERVELGERDPPARRREPRGAGRMLAERGRDVRDDAEDPLLLRGREVTLGVEPPDGAAQRGLRGGQRALVARASIAVQLCGRLGDGSRKNGCGVVDRMEAEVVLPGVQRLKCRPGTRFGNDGSGTGFGPAVNKT